MSSIYIAGPIRSDPDYVQHFAEAEEILINEGWTVVNPVSYIQKTGQVPGVVEDDIAGMLWDLDQVGKVDAICLLSGWDRSEGAKLELGFARYCDKDIYYFDNATPPEFDTICQEADFIVNGPRQANYGHPRVDFSRTAHMWESVFGIEVTPEQVALAMICLKISRLVQTPDHRDSLVDIAGYAATYEKVRGYTS